MTWISSIVGLKVENHERTVSILFKRARDVIYLRKMRLKKMYDNFNSIIREIKLCFISVSKCINAN